MRNQPQQTADAAPVTVARNAAARFLLVEPSCTHQSTLRALETREPLQPVAVGHVWQHHTAHQYTAASRDTLKDQRQYDTTPYNLYRRNAFLRLISACWLLSRDTCLGPCVDQELRDTRTASW
eukprot:2310245-Rhodomonas_salina.5